MGTARTTHRHVDLVDAAGRPDGRWSMVEGRRTRNSLAFGVIQRIRWSMVEGGVITVMAVKPTSCQGM